ncbi:MAG: 50S ribosomal protein L10 [Candidatus Pacebacteria bacterium]|nr:50S ribosomal protein L10 [Candidatus Paceibacterota bacterium]
MPLTKEQKKKALEALRDKISKKKSIVFVDFAGLKVKDMSALRKKLRQADSEFKAAKKTLMGIVFKEAKIDADIKKLPGEIALVLGYKDEVTPAKLAWDASKEYQNLKILGGILENKFVGVNQIEALAKLPAREVLLANLVGSLNSPISNLVYALNYNIKGLVYLLNKIEADKR